MYDIKTNQSRYLTPFSHPKKESWRVHDGFQTVFQGVRTSARRALKEAIESLNNGAGTRNGEWDLVLTAHSLGAAISYLFLLDVLHEGTCPHDGLIQECEPLSSIPPSVNVTIASFGPPRLANPALVEHFLELARDFRKRRGREDAFTEWTVIGHNDGKFWLYPAFIQVEPFIKVSLACPLRHLALRIWPQTRSIFTEVHYTRFLHQKRNTGSFISTRPLYYQLRLDPGFVLFIQKEAITTMRAGTWKNYKDD